MGRHLQEGTYVIRDLESLKVIADPIRNQILEVLQFEPLNTKEVAEKLGLAPSKLYYHFNMLEKIGLIKVVETRQVSNLIEKYYQSVSNYFMVDPALLNFESVQGKENLNTVIETAFDTTREDLLRSLQVRALQKDQGSVDKKRSMMITRNVSNMDDEQAESFLKRFNELVKEFEEADTRNPQHQTFAITVAFYPSFYFRDLSSEKE